MLGFLFLGATMSEQRKAKIIIEGGKIKVQDQGTGRVVEMGPTMPTQGMTEERVRGMKQQLERAGNKVEVKDM